jgi:hypothetical protein
MKSWQYATVGAHGNMFFHNEGTGPYPKAHHDVGNGLVWREVSLTSSINDTIREREQRYGSLDRVSLVSQLLKEIIHDTQYRGLRSQFHYLHEEALDMICHKLARIICGDPNYADSWHDLGGFAVRVAQILDERNKEANNGNGNEAEKKSY